MLVAMFKGLIYDVINNSTFSFLVPLVMGHYVILFAGVLSWSY